MSQVNSCYVYLDGDGVGDNLRRLLLQGKYGVARSMSSSIKQAMFLIYEYLKQDSVETLICGGDDVFFRVNDTSKRVELTTKVQEIFLRTTGMTMSFGYGNSVKQCIDNLQISKAKSGERQKLHQKRMESKKVDRQLARNERMTDKSSILYLFATSKRADPYINSICYCFIHFNLKSVVLVDVSEIPEDRDYKLNDLSNLKENIHEQLRALKEGKYVKFIKNGTRVEKVEERISIDEISQRRYSEISSLTITREVVRYSQLRQYFLDNEVGEAQALYDLTSARSRYLIEIYTLLRLMRKHDIYILEIYRTFRFNHEDLIFSCELREGNLYKYLCLSDLGFTSGKQIILDGDYERMVQESDKSTYLHEQQKCFEKLAEGTANEFARWCTFSLTVSTAVLILVGWIYIPPSWEFIEPRVELLPLIFLVISYSIQIILGRGDVSFNPLKFYSALKKWKLRRLKKVYRLPDI